ncbi:F-box only protein 27-like [Sus scrofa]|uniref:F-box only protein 27-like n=1 Tax=Sus scrofa TaxID=9823 RepID=UPI000A2AF65C|nr:F-box only protein 27-like [Sus scrofa]
MPCEATDHSASLDQPMMDLVPEPKVEEALGLNQLPSELLLMVLSQVPPRMLIRHCRQVCRRWRALVDCQDLWLIILARDHRALWPVLQSCLPPADDTRPSVLGRFCVRRPLHQNLFRDPKGEEDFQKRPRVSREEEVALKEKWQGVIRRAGWKNSFRYLYRWFEKKQVVDLQEEGLWPELLDSGKIEIWVSDWRIERRQSSKHRYELTVLLLDANKSILHRFAPLRFPEQPRRKCVFLQHGASGPSGCFLVGQGSTTSRSCVAFLTQPYSEVSWKQSLRITHATLLVNHEFSNLKKGVRFVSFEHTIRNIEYRPECYKLYRSSSSVSVLVRCDQQRGCASQELESLAGPSH